MKKLIFNTTNSLAPILSRVFLGSVILAHGAQKLLGWFGGYGFQGTMSFFTDTVGLPPLFGFLIIILESFGSIALIIGITTRLLASLFLGLAVGIVYTTHWKFGFFMNWFGNQSGEGFEYFLLWIGLALTLVLTGGGRYSVDRFISKENE